MTSTTPGGAWVVVIPVKESHRGKSRLQVAGVDRVDLARAVALDTITAAAACAEVARVVVVTNDREVSATAAGPRVEVWAEGVGAGLDAAIALGMGRVGDAPPRAALLGDLPALRPGDLGAALRLASAHERGVVADTEGTGSTLVTAAGGTTWTSAFGADSFARHVALGCSPLAVPDSSTLRRDVDTADQLISAAERGLGPYAAALFRVGPPHEETVAAGRTTPAGHPA